MFRVGRVVALALATVGQCEQPSSETCSAGDPGCGVQGASMLQAKTHHGKLHAHKPSKAKVEQFAKMAQVKRHFQKHRHQQMIKNLHKSKGKLHRDGDCGDCKGCQLYGECHVVDPEGKPATAELCWNHTGTWCGDLKDGQTPPPPPPLPQFCSSAEKFTPKKHVGQSGSCNGKDKPIPVHDCEMGGCWGWEYEDYETNEMVTHCECPGKMECDALNGEYFAPTCSDIAQWSASEALQQANEAGSCDGIQSHYGGPLSEELTWVAADCCTDFPATFCEPSKQIVYPCEEADDFEHHKLLWGWCEHAPQPTKDDCESAGCQHWEWEGTEYCYCEKQDECEKSGGKYQGQSCGEEMKWWSEESTLLEQAKKDGTCGDLAMPWGELLTDRVDYMASQCCSSYPKTACS